MNESIFSSAMATMQIRCVENWTERNHTKVIFCILSKGMREKGFTLPSIQFLIIHCFIFPHIRFVVLYYSYHISRFSFKLNEWWREIYDRTKMYLWRKNPLTDTCILCWIHVLNFRFFLGRQSEKNLLTRNGNRKL